MNAKASICPQCNVPLTEDHVYEEHVVPHKELNLKYHQLCLLPHRARFLQRDLAEDVRRTLDARKPVMFMCNAFQENMWAKNGSPVITFTGVLPCGSKAVVGLTDVPIYFDVYAPFEDVVTREAKIQAIKFSKEKVQQFLLHGFQVAPVSWCRFHLYSIWDRKNMLAAIKKLNEDCAPADRIITASDDVGGNGHFLRMVARNYKFMTCGWNRLSNYVKLDAKGYNAEYRINLPISDFKDLGEEGRKEMTRSNPLLAAVLDKDSTLSASWDMETNTKSPHKAVPRKGDPYYTIFMVNSMYSWYHSVLPLLDICCVDVPTEATRGVIVIECDNEKEVLLAHLHVAKKMHPELLVAFNGSNFDWPLFIDKATRHNVIAAVRDSLYPQEITEYDKIHKRGLDLIKYGYNSEKMKIDAENFHAMDTVVSFPSLVDIDVRPIFMKLYPKAEGNNSSSLNYYLARNKLESKEDMPFKVMFKVHDRAHMLRNAPAICHCESINTQRVVCLCCQDKQKHIDCVKIGEGEDAIDYSDELLPELVRADGTPKCCFCGKRPKNYRDMGLVAFYCAVDCLRPQQLMVKRAIILERRELACKSYVPLYDAIYRADGQKVKNLTGSVCYTMNIAFSNAASGKKPKDKEHFSGGYVFPPVRGLNNTDPITGLDFASLYPSLMMAYNHSPDMVVTCPVFAAKLRELGYTLHDIGPIHYEVGEEKGAASNTKMVGHAWSVRHNGIHSKNDTHIIERYERQVVVTCKGQTRKYVGLPVYDKPASCDPFDWLADMRENGVDDTGFDHTTTGVADLVPIRGRLALPGERMGIFPCIVKELFDSRVPIKRLWVSLDRQLKEMGMTGAKIGMREVDGELKEFTLEQLQMMFVMVEVKQKAIKVLANTFYGISGDYLNSLYSLFVGAAITESGQNNIKRVRDFVIGKGFTVMYGDTDSLYITCPRRVYTVAFERYQAAICALKDAPRAMIYTVDEIKPAETEEDARLRLKEEYWKEMILITMKVIANLTGQVSEFLMWDNGTRFLNMAYEEVGFPTMLCGKKKYLLVAHLDPKTIDLYPDELFVKGIESVKQGQTTIAKRAANLFMHTVVSPKFTGDPLELTLRIIKDDYTTPINYRDFVLSSRYKPDKENVPVKTFVARMTARSDAFRAACNHKDAEFTAPPEPGDKFEYVIVKKEQEFDLRGRKIPILKGHKMEYVRVYLASLDTSAPMEIDNNYYMESAYLRIFARFIAYDRRFAHPTVEPTDDARYKIVDEYSNNAAEKFLVNYLRSLSEYDAVSIAARGKQHKQLFRAVNKSIKCAMLTPIKHKFGDKISAASEMVSNAIAKIHSVGISSPLSARLFQFWIDNKANLLEVFKWFHPSSYVIKVQHACLQRNQDAGLKTLQSAALVVYDVLCRREQRTKEVLSRLRESGDMANLVVSTVDSDYISEMEEGEKVAMFDYQRSLSVLKAIEQIRFDLSETYGLLIKHRRKIAGERIARPANFREMAKEDSVCDGELHTAPPTDDLFGLAYK